MLTSGPPVLSGPAGSAWDVRAWASHTKPNTTGRLYTWNVPKSCSMEMCALGSYGTDLQQSNPALELPLVRRTANCNINADFLRLFLLKVEKTMIFY